MAPAAAFQVDSVDEVLLVVLAVGPVLPGGTFICETTPLAAALYVLIVRVALCVEGSSRPAAEAAVEPLLLLSQLLDAVTVALPAE